MGSTQTITMNRNTKCLRTPIGILSLIAFALATLTAPVRADHNSEAVKHLEMAKTAAKPAEHLEEAKKSLGTGETKATPHIDEAIAAASKNDHKGMEKHIDMAIKELQHTEKAEKTPKK